MTSIIDQFVWWLDLHFNHSRPGRPWVWWICDRNIERMRRAAEQLHRAEP